MIHHTYHQNVFVPPTENTPGKSGTVPGPEVIASDVQPYTFLGSDAVWHKFNREVFGKDLATLNDEVSLVGVTRVNGDANKCVSAGAYISDSWVNTPGITGLLLTVQERYNYDNSTKYGVIQTFFFSYSGPGSYRTTIYGGIDVGRMPNDSEWAVWRPTNMPMPRGDSGVGQFFDLQLPNGYISNTLPAGGVWMYWAIWEGMPPYYAVVANHIGIVAGGTLVQDVSTAAITLRMRGWAWRVF